MSTLKGVFTSFTVISVLLASAAAEARSPRHASESYEGSARCNAARSFATGDRYTVTNHYCTVELDVSYDRTDWTGDELGSFTYRVVSERTGRTFYSDSGYFKVSPRSGWRVYFNFGGRSYPRAGVDYPYGTKHRNSVTLYSGRQIQLRKTRG